MIRRKYSKPTCEHTPVEMDSIILAESTNKNSVVSSVGQEVDVDVTFTDESFVNQNWVTE